ncbi:ATP-binding cassette domain-containing protein [Methanocorpusculum vombati]|uniref:ATP-binding cassette domain-containing protein n=1 Tax=Methanocorpusculum vombati TaxID=3002864 RepID=A0ABT4IJC3_9EURY|nr:ATP-binding cassette domain-containing protein [Methanocorpusculum vombati]MCZ9313762.1 ATP-binding cassette domain-containing protein [Methanocorpusculum sp.]MCZ9319540.1 ATP-binding cassette domain-containing protein [Methanocorpusculum sp.]MDE2521198.1 ATP-binding cassette domain-containing protein [Methanocorpusculum sp.]MDE2534935.1 ATP-binding cassette domain-containing protein [Methanocorpusculum sp.]
MNLVFDAVRFRRDAFTLAADAVFSRGVHLISGRIGTGKSTLALAAAGLLTPDAGKIRYEGCSGTPLLLMQFPEYQITGTTVTGEIASWNITGNEETFAHLNVTPSNRDPFTLSRGELRRLELACILARESDLLILDEPYASLDQCAKPVLTRLLEQRSGITLVFSHETEGVPAAADHWTIRNGELQHE